MAFKMKGSAFKLNNVATKSALKDSMADKVAARERSNVAKRETPSMGPEQPVDDLDRSMWTKHDALHADPDGPSPHGGSRDDKEKSAMKSPLEHKSSRDGKYIMVDGKKTKQTHSHVDKEGKKMTEEEVNKANVRKKSMKSPLEQTMSKPMDEGGSLKKNLRGVLDYVKYGSEPKKGNAAKAITKGVKSKLRKKSMKSPLEQKLNENPHAVVQDRYRGKEKSSELYIDPRTGEESKVFRNDPWDPIKGVIRPNEEQWYEDNPNMSPTADEQDIFAGRDIQATRAQYRKNPDTGYRYTPDPGRGGSRSGNPSRFVSMEDDMGKSGINDKANVNRSIRLEKEKRKDERRKGEMNWPK